MKFPLALIFAFTALAAAAQAGDLRSGRDSYLVFQLDNDLFTGSDRNYTNGARLAYLRPIAEKDLNWIQKSLRTLGGTGDSRLFNFLAVAVDPDQVRFDWGIGLTQLMFTPSDPEWTEAPPGERPYAGWLGMEFSLHAKDSRAVSSVVLSVGVTGEYSFAEETQKWVHTHISGSPVFQGWDSQIPGEVTVNLNFDQKRRFGDLARATRDWLMEVDGYLEWGAGIGNFRTDAYVGTLLRTGIHLPVQYATPRIQLGNYSHELFLPGARVNRSEWSLYLFGGARGTAVAHDITLDGPVFRSFDTGVSSEPLVGELVAGVGFRLGSFTLTFSRTFRTKEFDGQEQGHQFGSILASIGF